jgi:hypothetical protein
MQAWERCPSVSEHVDPSYVHTNFPTSCESVLWLTINVLCEEGAEWSNTDGESSEWDSWLYLKRGTAHCKECRCKVHKHLTMESESLYSTYLSHVLVSLCTLHLTDGDNEGKGGWEGRGVKRKESWRWARRGNRCLRHGDSKQHSAVAVQSLRVMQGGRRCEWHSERIGEQKVKIFAKMTDAR